MVRLAKCEALMVPALSLSVWNHSAETRFRLHGRQTERLVLGEAIQWDRVRKHWPPGESGTDLTEAHALVAKQVSSAKH